MATIVLVLLASLLVLALMTAVYRPAQAPLPIRIDRTTRRTRRRLD
ncbi:MAG: hypothetical protein AB4911_22480 [Oscillochloridaceae bacterium umkhey_bin13]